MMTFSECKKLALDIEPVAFIYSKRRYETKRYYQSMVTFLYGTFNMVQDVETLHQATRFKKSTIESIVENLTETGIWANGIAHMEVDPDDSFSFMIEIVLCSACAAGELSRVIVYPPPAIPLTHFAILQFNTLSLLKEVKEIQSARESHPYQFGKF